MGNWLGTASLQTDKDCHNVNLSLTLHFDILGYSKQNKYTPVEDITLISPMQGVQISYGVTNLTTSIQFKVHTPYTRQKVGVLIF